MSAVQSKLFMISNWKVGTEKSSRLVAACLLALTAFMIAPAQAAQTIPYWGGPVISKVKIVPVFWNSSVNIQVRSNMTQFFKDLNSKESNSAVGWWNVVKLYNTRIAGGTRQNIFQGSVAKGITITPSINSGNITDAQLQSELVNQIAAGHLPSPTANTFFAFFFPPNVTVTLADGEVSGVNFCYYNSTAVGASSIPIAYAFVIDTFGGAGAIGCGTSASALANTTALASTVLADAVTDPEIGLVPSSAGSFEAPAAWGSNTLGQIGDACYGGAQGTFTSGGRTWAVNPIYANILARNGIQPCVTSYYPAPGRRARLGSE